MAKAACCNQTACFADGEKLLSLCKALLCRQAFADTCKDVSLLEFRSREMLSAADIKLIPGKVCLNSSFPS